MSTCTGYGTNSRFNCVFDGDEKNYEMWEVRFLSYLKIRKLKAVVLRDVEADPPADVVQDNEKNELAYAELVQALDKRSLGLVMRDATNDCRKALKILREHYAGAGKPRIIVLYSTLSNIVKSPNETVTDYILRAEAAAGALENADEKVSNPLMISMVCKGLPDEYDTFIAMTLDKKEEQTFAEFKSSLRNFEENRKSAKSNDSDNVMYNRSGMNKQPTGGDIICFKCSKEGHKANACPTKKKSKKWCTHCKSPTHVTEKCRKLDAAKKAADADEAADNSGDWIFMVNDTDVDTEPTAETHAVIDDDEPATEDVIAGDAEQTTEVLVIADDGREDEIVTDEPAVITETESVNGIVLESTEDSDFDGDINDYDLIFMVKQSDLETTQEDVLVDCGATSHIVTDDASFIELDPKFNPGKHFIELADGQKVNNIALKRGKAQIYITDKEGKTHTVTLDKCLYIPSYPQNIFSVQAATAKGAIVYFRNDSSELILHDKTFEIKKKGRLYYLTNDVTYVNVVKDLMEWHGVLGHCNLGDVMKLENFADGMVIKGKERSDCETCIASKISNQRSRTPATRATKPFQMVSSDVCGPVQPVSLHGFNYCISFIDNYTGYIFVYFIKRKSDATKALQKFLADTSPYGKVEVLQNTMPEGEVKKMRTDGGGEYMGKEFTDVLLKHSIKHETSAPYSSHQNGIAERGWRTLFEMGRCLISESGIPKFLWPYAIKAAAYIRNRCYTQRIRTTPYFLMTD